MLGEDKVTPDSELRGSGSFFVVLRDGGGYGGICDAASHLGSAVCKASTLTLACLPGQMDQVYFLFCCFGASPAVFRGSSWPCTQESFSVGSGDSIGCRGWNPGQLCAMRMPSPLCYGSDPTDQTFTGQDEVEFCPTCPEHGKGDRKVAPKGERATNTQHAWANLKAQER